MGAIQLKNVTKKFGDQMVIDDLNLSIEDGSFSCLHCKAEIQGDFTAEGEKYNYGLIMQCEDDSFTVYGEFTYAVKYSGEKSDGILNLYGRSYLKSGFRSVGKHIVRLCGNDGVIAELGTDCSIANLQDDMIDIEPPTIVEGLTVNRITGKSFRIVWKEASDNKGVTAYRIYRNGSLLQETKYCYADISDEEAQETAVYTVTAVDAAGMESTGQSNPVETKAEMPAFTFIEPGEGTIAGK